MKSLDRRRRRVHLWQMTQAPRPLLPFRRHLGQTLVLGLPLVGSLVTRILIGLTDTLMLGRYSVEALAAGALGSSTFFTMFILAAGFSIAAMGSAADAAGRGDERTVRRTARMGLWLSLGAGLASMPLLWFSEPILLVAGQEARTAADTQDFLRIAMLGLVPALLASTLQSHLSALERTRILLWATLVSAVLNLGLNWLLIFGNAGAPEMGIRGAAWASVLSHAAGAGVLALYAARGPDMARWEMFRNLWRMDREILLRSFHLGWPVGLTLLSESALFTGTALMMGAIGSAPLAAHGIVIQVAAATFMIHLGLSQAATVRIGRFAGQGDAVELRRAAWAALALSGGAVALSVAVYLGAGRWIVAAFLDMDDPQAPAILALGVSLIGVAALFQLVDAAQVMALGFLRGVQDTHRPMLLAAVSYWGIGIPASLLLGFTFGAGPVGVWLGLVIGLAVAAILMMARFFRLAPVQGGPAMRRD